jgi:hypothetical protein
MPALTARMNSQRGRIDKGNFTFFEILMIHRRLESANSTKWLVLKETERETLGAKPAPDEKAPNPRWELCFGESCCRDCGRFGGIRNQLASLQGQEI